MHRIATKARLVAAALALCGAVVFAMWAMQTPPATPPAPATPAAESPEIASASLPTDKQVADAAPVTDKLERQALAPEAGPSTGSLLVHAVWGDDKTPAAGVTIELYIADADRLFGHPRLATDANGEARFGELQPGRVYPQVLRGESNGAGERVDIQAGRQAEVRIELPIGMTARGRVLDTRQQPVADAEVLVCGWTGGETLPLQRTDADGRFLLRAVGTHSHIGARAAGYAPSPLREFTGSEGGTVDFTIVLDQQGAELRGVVLDPQQRPVAGAVVQAGREGNGGGITLPDGARAIAPLPARTRSEADGTFVFRSVAPGQVALAVRAPGLASWSQDLEVRLGIANVITVRLQAGVTLIGSVRDADGAPVAKVDVDVGDWRDLARRSCRSGADGSFRIDGLAVGGFEVSVRGDGGVHSSRRIVAAAGETVRCDFVLARGIDLHGRVLDADGKPVAKAMVEARQEQPKPGASWWGMENTDAEGRFRLKNCEPEAPIRISVRRKSTFDELAVEHVVPGSDELLLQLPKEAWIHIRGVIVDPDGKPLANVHVSPFKKGGNGSPADTNDATTGAFDLGPYPPGDYSLRLAADGFPTVNFPLRTVGPDAVWDVGTVQMQRGGFAAVTLLHPEGQPLPALSLYLYESNGAHRSQLELQDGRGQSGPLVPGDYLLQVSVRDMACLQQPFSIRAGVTTPVDVVLQRGAAVEIEVALPATATPASIDVVVSNAAGAVVMRGTAWSRSGPSKLSISLLPGSYRIAASTAGAAGDTTLEVTAAGPNRARVALSLR